jgi:hypothetical protein
VVEEVDPVECVDDGASQYLRFRVHSNISGSL